MRLGGHLWLRKNAARGVNRGSRPHKAICYVQRRHFIPWDHQRSHPTLASIYRHLPPVPVPEPNPRARNVAVIGGGITGLAAAYNLMKELPQAKITIFEQQERLGGWLESEVVPVGNGSVLFEWGPRTIRNNSELGSGRYTAQLMAQLNMVDKVIPTSAKSPAALNRYIYYPDHLVRMPGLLPKSSKLESAVSNIWDFLREPIFNGVLSGALAGIQHFTPYEASLKDQSVGDFVARNCGRQTADNLVSALLHGIYAGDLYKLSMKSLYPMLWQLEKSTETPILSALGKLMINRQQLTLCQELEFMIQSDQTLDMYPSDARRLKNEIQDSSVFTFVNGLGQLAAEIEAALRDSDNVTIEKMRARLTFDQAKSKIHITNGDDPSRTVKKDDQTRASAGAMYGSFDYVIAAVRPDELGRMLVAGDQSESVGDSKRNADIEKAAKDIKALAAPTTNVMVVNFFFGEPDLLPVRGFGYLIPRSLPWEQNPEFALGVIFGSETSGRGPSANPDGSLPSSGVQDTIPGTKLTVMLGGHWWQSWPESWLMDEAEAIKMAQNVLTRQLGINASPLVAKAKLQRNAIPQYTVGHHDRMLSLHRILARQFRGRLKVAGSAYSGVGVNDCVMAARRVALAVRNDYPHNINHSGENGDQIESTGLEWDLEIHGGPNGDDKLARWAVFEQMPDGPVRMVR